MGKSSTPAATVRPAGLGDQGSRRGSPFGSGLEAGTNGELYGARLIVVKVRPVPAITPESAPEKHSGRLTSSASDAPGRGACVLGCGFTLDSRWPLLSGWWGSQGCFGHAGAFAVVAYADRDTGAGIAIVTNASRSLTDMVRRFAPLGSAIRRALRETS